MKNLTANLTGIKSTAVRALAGMALAGAVLAAAPAAQAQRIYFGIGAPRHYAPAPRVVVAPPVAVYGGYYGYGYRHDDWRFRHDDDRFRHDDDRFRHDGYRHGWR